MSDANDATRRDGAREPGQVLTDAEVEAATARLLEPGPLALRWRAFAERHGVLLGRLRRVWVVWAWLSIVAFIVALVLVPSLGTGIKPALWSYVILLQFFLLARTKTLSWRLTAVAFVAACLVAPLIGLADVAFAGLIGADINSQDGAVLVAGPIEELGKLLPVLLVVWLARRRSARLAAADFLLLGGISGLGFQAVEDTIRRLAQTLRQPSLLDLLDQALGLPGQGHHYGFGLLPGWSQNDASWFAGHHVGTAIAAAGIGLALRARPAPRARWVAAAGLLLMVILDHALYNAGFSSDDPRLANTVAVPDWLENLHQAWGAGGLQRPLLLVLLVLCMVADVRRTRRMEALLPPLPRVRLARVLDRFGAGLGDRLPGVAERHPVAVPVAAAGRWLAWTAADIVNEIALVLLVWASGPRNPGAGDEQALPLLHRVGLALTNLRQRRELAQGLGRLVEGLSDRTRRRPVPVTALLALTLLLPLVGLVVLGVGGALDATGGAGQVGPDAPAFLANLFEDIATWWDSIGTVGQIATVLAIAALLTFGFGFAVLPALGLAATLTAVGDYGHGIATFLRDPRQATRDFLANLTPGQVIGYAIEILLGRLVPGGLGGAAGRRARELYDLNRRYPGHARGVVRDGLRDLRHDDTGAVRLGRGRPSTDELFGTGRRGDPDYELPSQGRRTPPASRVQLTDISPETLDEIMTADPGTLDPVARRLQLDYQRNLRGPDGSPLEGEALQRRLRELRAEGRSWTNGNRAPVNGKFAGQRIFLSDPQDAASYPDGVYYDLRGYPDFQPYTRRELVLPTTGNRDRDIWLANRAMQRRGDAMWQGVQTGRTPTGWTWHHVQGGQRMQLIPTAVHEAAQHTGGIGTA